MNNTPVTLLADFYKLSHREQYPENTEYIYSNFTPRSNKYFPKADNVVVFGIQGFVKKYLINYFNENFFNRKKEDVVNEYVRIVKHSLGKETVDTSHIEDLHDLGYLPIKLKALKEGTLAPIKTPLLTIENTNPKFFWLTNYLETLMSTEIWLPMTSATIAYEYRKLLDKYAIDTTGATDGVEFQGHDFSMRGMSSVESATTSGSGHLLSFVGTDTIPSITYHEDYYNANVENEVVGTSISATEHSVMCAYGEEDEFELFKRLITKTYPNGFFSVVSDTWDFWKVVGEYLPKLKDEIMQRDGRVVIRPDSGNPVDILCGKIAYDVDLTRYYNGNIKDLEEDIYDTAFEWANEACEGSYNCGNDFYIVRFKIGEKIYDVEVGFSYNRYDKTYYYVENQGFKSEGVQWDTLNVRDASIEDKGLIEALWDVFGGTVTEKGYKLLDGHIGAIYGDSITLDRAEQIVERLKQKGFASTNVVFGIGSYTYQYNTRDTFGFAMKATYAVVDGEERMLFKNPKTDDGTKKSLKGLVAVVKANGELAVVDGLNKHSYDHNFSRIDQLEVVFENGELKREQTLAEIRGILKD